MLLLSLSCLAPEILPWILNWVHSSPVGSYFAKRWNMDACAVSRCYLDIIMTSVTIQNIQEMLSYWLFTVMWMGYMFGITQIISNFNQVFFFFCTIQRAKLELPMFAVYHVFEIIKN